MTVSSWMDPGNPGNPGNSVIILALQTPDSYSALASTKSGTGRPVERPVLD